MNNVTPPQGTPIKPVGSRKGWRNRLRRVVRRLPIPTAGQWTPVMGLVGFFGWALGTSALIGTLLYAGLSTGAINPAREDEVFQAQERSPDPLDIPFILPGSAPDRITILLMGADTRPSETGYRTPTDTMMLITVEPDSGQVGILSMPRDLYVDVPGEGYDRINTAYVHGGGDVAMQTVENTLDVEVDHFVLVQFNAFVTLVDEIGGIDLYVPYTIDDPEFPAECYSRSDCGFEPLYIEAGQQHMDGYTALRYARTRHGDSDFERARRQQQVILAIREKVVRLDMLPRLIQRAPTLYSTVASSIVTDMSVDEMLELVTSVGDVSDEQIRTGVIDGDYVTPIRSPEGSSVLEPKPEAIKELINHVFWLDEET